MIKAILFDFDGTLINTNDVIIDAWQHTYRHYGKKEKPVSHITACFGEPLLISVAREFPGVDPEESAEVYRARQRDKADELVNIFDGIKELLQELRRKGCKLCIVTSRTRESTVMYLERFEISDYFEEIVSCDDTDKHKPDPAPVRLGLKRTGAEPYEALMIGDTDYDMKSARSAGVRTVMVGWSLAAAGKRRSEFADFAIEKPMDLTALLQKI